MIDWFRRIIERRHDRRVIRQWPQALLFISGAVSSGATLDEALEHLAREAPEPLRSCVVRRSRDAVTTEARIRQVLQEPSLRFTRQALLLYAQAGGRVGRMLETCASVLQDRIEAQERVRALTAQARASAWIISMAPFALGLALGVLSPDLAGPMIHTEAGRKILFSVAAMVTLGLILAQRLARVEP